MPRFAYDPPVSERQRRAMYAAAEGRSTLGIPKRVGQEFVGKDMDPDSFRAIFRGLLGMARFFGEEMREPEHQGQDALPLAAGVIHRALDGSVLLLRRGTSGDHAGEWCWPGGHVEDGETLEQAARRECNEEIGYAPDGELHAVDRSQGESEFTTFVHDVAEKFDPKLNNEHDRWCWATMDALPSPLHPGVLATLKRGAADGMSGGSIGYSVGSKDCAMDRASVRSYDADGRLHVEMTPISKANICEYYGREIPGAEDLGLDPDRKYRLLRHPDELKKAAPTFNNLPVLSQHVPVTVDEHPKELVLGSTGTDAAFDHPYLNNSLVFWSRDGVDGIENETKKQLSSAYRYRADMTPGEYEGEKYDGIMRDIVGNHVALVKEGRAGPDVVVGDSKTPNFKEQFDMAKVVLSRFAALCAGAMGAYLAPKLAQDAKVDLPSILADVSAKNFKAKRPEIVARLKTATAGKLAKDANIDGAENALANLEGAEVQEGMDTDENTGLPMSEEEMRKKAKDAEPHAELLKFLESCGMKPEHMEHVHKLLGGAAAAKDEPPKTPGTPETHVTQKAMDEAIRAAADKARNDAVATHKSIRDAENFVRPWVGALAIACDSADAVLRAAASALKIKGAETMHPDALRVVIEMQPKPGDRKTAVAQDEATAPDASTVDSYSKMFPGAARLGHMG